RRSPPPSTLLPYTTLFRSLRVVALGGSTYSGGSFRGTLSAYVEPFDADFDVSLTPVTTMADRLRVVDGRPAAQAEQRIANYLALDRKSTRLNSSHVKISYA